MECRVTLRSPMLGPGIGRAAGSPRPPPIDGTSCPFPSLWRWLRVFVFWFLRANLAGRGGQGREGTKCVETALEISPKMKPTREPRSGTTYRIKRAAKIVEAASQRTGGGPSPLLGSLGNEGRSSCPLPPLFSASLDARLALFFCAFSSFSQPDGAFASLFYLSSYFRSGLGLIRVRPTR